MFSRTPNFLKCSSCLFLPIVPICTLGNYFSYSKAKFGLVVSSTWYPHYWHFLISSYFYCGCKWSIIYYFVIVSYCIRIFFIFPVSLSSSSFIISSDFDLLWETLPVSWDWNLVVCYTFCRGDIFAAYCPYFLAVLKLCNFPDEGYLTLAEGLGSRKYFLLFWNITLFPISFFGECFAECSLFFGGVSFFRDCLLLLRFRTKSGASAYLD